jgi:hypothetical protein
MNYNYLFDNKVKLFFTGFFKSAKKDYFFDKQVGAPTVPSAVPRGSN